MAFIVSSLNLAFDISHSTTLAWLFLYIDMNRNVLMINGQYQHVQWIITHTNIITSQSQHDIKARADFVGNYIIIDYTKGILMENLPHPQ